MSEAAAPLPAITLFESYGSGASYIGPKVAQALGIPFHRQAFSSEEIEGADTRRPDEDSPVGRVLVAMSGSYSLASLEGRGVATAQRDDHDLVLQNTRTVLELARQGGVFLGRNATRILANRPNTLHVKLDGPLPQRIERAAMDGGISPERAEKRRKHEDQLRAQMSIDLYGWDPRDFDSYDLVVNTGKLSLDTTVGMIAAAFKAKVRPASA